MTLAPDVVNQVAMLLGRHPRGLEEVAVEGDTGEPIVIRVSSLVEDKPFPTLFWLVDPTLCYCIDQLEAGGLIKELQQRIDEDPQLQLGMRHDHQAHILLREGCMRPAVRQRLLELNLGEALASRGIGGIANFTRIRCLHTWYGAHLVVRNTVGNMLDDYWSRLPH